MSDEAPWKLIAKRNVIKGYKANVCVECTNSGGSATKSEAITITLPKFVDCKDTMTVNKMVKDTIDIGFGESKYWESSRPASYFYKNKDFSECPIT
jgi:hypothetical protein